MSARSLTVGGVTLAWRPTPWDARGLGVATVELTAVTYQDARALPAALAALDDALIADGIGLASTRVASVDVALVDALTTAGFAPVERSHPLALGLATASLPRRTVAVEVATVDDRDALVALARDGFDYSRFHEDVRIHPSRSRDRYARWIADSLAQQLAGTGDEVWVHRHHGALAAVMTFRRRADHVQLYLGGTAPGLGLVAPMFWTGVLARLRAEGVVTIDTRVSAANVAAMRLHAALGFAIIGADVGCTKIYDATVGQPSR